MGVFLQVPESIVFLFTWDYSLFGVLLSSVFCVCFVLRHNLCSGSYSRNPTWSGLRFYRYIKKVLYDSWLNLSLFLS